MKTEKEFLEALVAIFKFDEGDLDEISSLITERIEQLE